jgi:hypothetical protein
MLNDIIADDIAQTISIPIPATQDRLLPPRTGIASEKPSSRRLTSRTSSVSDDDPRWRSPEAGHGFETGFENGSAAEELRRRCA